MFLFRLQRRSAVALIPFLVVHLLATWLLGQSELTAADVLAATRGSVVWLGFYGCFVLLVAVHAPLGVWQILRPLIGMPFALKLGIAVGLAIVIIVLGVQALAGLYL